MGRQDLELVKQFDTDSNGWLNAAERQAARQYLAQSGGSMGRRGPGGPGGRRGGFGGNESAPQPGIKISPAEVKSHGDALLYASNVLRTLFLEFESSDWEKELEAFYKTDVDVPAKLTMDGRSYPDVGVRFRGNTSYMMVGSGGKRPLNLSMDMVHAGQNLLGFRTLNLLNSHEDPSFLRTILSLQMARDYMPAPAANFVRLVINGENWGIYANVAQFNKDFLRDWFNTTKGMRWKVPAGFGGRGGLEYLGDEAAPYQRIYEIKSKDEPKAWASLINLCKVLNETPVGELEAKLGAVLDIDGALRFLAWDNVLASGDGYWTRASDYSLYADPAGKFHLIPYDVNETFSSGGGPGGAGGPGGRGRGGFGRPEGPGGFGPGMFLAPQFVRLGDKDGDGRLSAAEFEGVAETWFNQIDTGKTGQIEQEQWAEGMNGIFQLPAEADRMGPPGGRPGRFGPGMFIGPAIFAAANVDNDKSLTRAELKEWFANRFNAWNVSKVETLDEEAIRNGLNSSLPRPEFGGPGGGPGRGGPSLDPLVAAQDTSKPLISKLLAVPAFRARYLGYVRHMAEKWLDWNKLGPLAKQYHSLIADEVRIDTKKIYSFEQFQNALEGVPQSSEGPGRNASLKAFVEQRRAYLLNHPEVKAAPVIAASGD